MYLTSNGALASLDKVKECLDAGLDSLKFSVNGHNKETYQLIHGVDDFEQVISNIENISRYKKENKLTFNLFTSTILTNYTESKRETFKGLLEEYVDEMVFLSVRNQGGLISDIITELSVHGEATKLTSCNLPFHGIHITHEGYLTACCVDFNNSLVVADLKETSLLEAWHCEKMQELRKKLLENDTENTMCYNCFHNTQEKFQSLSPEYGVKFDFSSLYQDKQLGQRQKEYNI